MDKEVYANIKSLAIKYKNQLKAQVDKRIAEMEEDDNSHYLLYSILGVDNEEGYYIDLYQNKGRFLYKYAGSFLEEAAVICIQHKYPNAKKVKINNTVSTNPKTFEIDCLAGKIAHEIKWRDATTDGDHIKKEHNRVTAIQKAGFHPVRIMFYYPQREQAIKIQQQLEVLYNKLGGEYYCCQGAFSYIKEYTGIDLIEILRKIDQEM